RINQPYHQLPLLKHIYKPKPIQLLNIYGHLKHPTHSHATLSNTSSKSLKYLLPNTPKTYPQSKYQPHPPQHTHLHHNQNLPNHLIDFLSKK
uniref:alpha/beta hydrolase n=1 Tax=Staphylococcus aureus TaxID=1280 RepID=UPI0011A42431